MWGLRSAVRSQIVYTLVYKQAKAPPMKYKHQIFFTIEITPVSDRTSKNKRMKLGMFVEFHLYTAWFDIYKTKKYCTTKQLGNDSSNSPLDKCATGSFAHNSSYTYLRYLNPHRRKFAPRSEAKLTRRKDTNFSPFCSQ